MAHFSCLTLGLLYFFSHTNQHHFFFFQENLIKEDKAANNNHSVLAAQSSPPEDDDDEAQADGPSQDGAPGDNYTLPNFSYKVEGYSIISSIGCGVSLTSVF